MRTPNRVVWLVVFVAWICLANSVQAQRADRGIITGIVTDPTGSAVVGAAVKVHNDGTGVDTVLMTNDAGAYTTPPLVLGTYSITVDHAGFKTALRTGVQAVATSRMLNATRRRSYRMPLSCNAMDGDATAVCRIRTPLS